MSDSSHKIVFSAIFTVILLIGGAVAIYLQLGDAPGASEPGARDGASSPIDAPGERATVVSTSQPGSPESPADAEAEDAPPVAAPPPSGPVSIQGKVIDSEGRGIPEAQIVALNLEEWNGVIEEHMGELARSSDPIRMIARMRDVLSSSAEKVARTESGDDGSYAFHNLAEGDYRLFTTHAEHLPDDQAWAIVESEPATLNIELLPGAFISGRVVDGSARPVAGATITAVPTYRGDSKGIGKMLQAYSTILEGRMTVKELAHRSTEDGSFRLGPIEPVAHDVIVKGANFVEARAFRVPPGAEDVVIVVEPGLKIVGTLLGPDAKPFAGADWTLKPTLNPDIANNPAALMRADFDILGESTRTGTSAQDGKFEITGLMKGGFELSFETSEHPVLRLTLDVSEPVTDLGELQLDESLSISGAVTDSTRAPAPGARVWIATTNRGPFTRPDQPSETVLVETTANDEGEFTLGHLAPGAYKVQASSPGYAGGSVEDVEAGSRNVALTLAEGATLAGRVLDAADRSPVAGARLLVMARSQSSGQTDEDGYFEIRGLGAPLNESATRTGSSVQHFQVQITHPDYSLAYQRLSTKEEGAPVTEVLLIRARQVSGVVVDEADAPVKNARVRIVVPGIPEFVLMFSPQGSPRRVFSAADGSFTVDLPGNMGRGMKMEVVASHPLYADSGVEIGEVGRPEETSPEVRIVLSSGSTIEGRVTDSAGQPVAGAQIRVKRPVQLQGEALMMSRMLPTESGKIAYSKADGSYRIRAVEEGVHQIEVGASGYAKTVIENVAVTGGQLTQDVVLDAGGVIRGVVVNADDEPLMGVEVVAFLDFQQVESSSDRMALEMIRFTGRGTSMARTDAEGRYSLKQLPEGEYTLVARAPGCLPAEQPGVSPGDAPPELVLRRFASLRVTVLDGVTGNPAPSFQIQVRREEAEGDRDPFGYQPVKTVDDGSGRLTRENLRPGQYQVGVMAKGFMPYFKVITIAEGEAAELTAALIPGLAVIGVVTEGESGEPIAGANVQVSRTQQDENRRNLGRLGMSESYISDENGIVRIDSLGEGAYRAFVSHSDYFPDDNESKFELPADEGKELSLRMRLAGRLRGRLTNLGPVDPREVGYQMSLTLRDETPPGEAGAGADREKGPTKRQRVEWVSIDLYNDRGAFERGSLPPGKYDVALRRHDYTVEDGRRIGNEGEEVPLGSVEIKPGATTTVNFTAPE